MLACCEIWWNLYDEWSLVIIGREITSKFSFSIKISIFTKVFICNNNIYNQCIANNVKLWNDSVETNIFIHLMSTCYLPKFPSIEHVLDIMSTSKWLRWHMTIHLLIYFKYKKLKTHKNVLFLEDILGVNTQKSSILITLFWLKFETEIWDNMNMIREYLQVILRNTSWFYAWASFSLYP